MKHEQTREEHQTKSKYGSGTLYTFVYTASKAISIAMLLGLLLHLFPSEYSFYESIHIARMSSLNYLIYIYPNLFHICQFQDNKASAYAL